jgi:hypothetical protein
MRTPLLVATVLLCATVAQAHKPSDSYLTVQRTGAGLQAQWDIALRDLEYAIGLDGDGDGAITWGEVRARQDAIDAYALARLHIAADGAACSTGPVAHAIERHSDGAYAALQFAVGCPPDPAGLEVRYDLFFDFDPQHRGLMQFVAGDAAPMVLFTADQRVQRLGSASVWRSLREFWTNGVWHIWTGYDHVLFLLALLMPGVLRRGSDGRWRAASLGDALWGTLKVVSAFTVAHSLTLSLAALGVVHLPARLIEAGIAASVALAAMNNAYPIFSDRRWLVGFGFGLLHGFGFASVLAEPHLPLRSLIVALLGFNLGVESGQLVIVAAFLPIAYMLRRSWMYQRLTLGFGSAAIAVLAAIWFVERALDLRLL